MVKQELTDDLAMLTGTVNHGNLEKFVLELLSGDKVTVTRYHKYTENRELLMALLCYLIEEKKQQEGHGVDSRLPQNSDAVQECPW